MGETMSALIEITSFKNRTFIKGYYNLYFFVVCTEKATFTIQNNIHSAVSLLLKVNFTYALEFS